MTAFRLYLSAFFWPNETDIRDRVLTTIWMECPGNTETYTALTDCT